jgi:hypothetical protein
MKKLAIFWTSTAALALLTFVATARAQVNTEPPGVARLSFIRGDVSVQRGDSGDTSAVELNTPLEAGDKVFTGPRSRTEIQLDWANMLRLDENAQATIASLDSKRVQVQILQGLAYFSTIDGADATVEIDTPNVAVNPRRAGSYRIEVTPAGETLVTVRDGEADISTPDGSTTLRKSDLITVRGTGSDVQFQITAALANDEFDRWNADRDRIVANAESYRRTNRYYTGASDLDSYGQWDNVADYGWVWVPRVAVGWAPYRHGRWVWTSYWGWTWTADEPWGWAPYHYGRWFVYRNSWVWWPGPVTRIYRPVYAPAYVSFFGFGARSGFSVGVSFGGGFGSIGWLPVGPCDYVNPWWGPHRGTFGVVSVTNIYNVHNVNMIAPLRRGDRDSNIHNMLTDYRVRSGLSTVSADSFGRGRAAVRNVGVAELREGRFMTGNVPVVPTRESLRTSDRTVVAGASRQQDQGRFFSRIAPSNQRESFADESARMQQAINPAGGGPSNRLVYGRGAETSGGPAGRSGNAAFSSQQGSQAPPQSRATSGESQGGWQRFGNGQRSRIEMQGDSRGEEYNVPSAQNRSNAPRTQPQSQPRANDREQPSSPAASLPRPNSRLIGPRNPDGEANAPAPNSGAQGGWQRFSGEPSGGNSFREQNRGGGAAPPQSSPRFESRPQLDLNRPIIEPRSFRGADSGPSRQSAPSNSQRFQAAPQSSPRAAEGSGRQGGGGGARSSGSRARGGGGGRR